MRSIILTGHIMNVTSDLLTEVGQAKPRRKMEEGITSSMETGGLIKDTLNMLG